MKKRLMIILLLVSFIYDTKAQNNCITYLPSFTEQPWPIPRELNRGRLKVLQDGLNGNPFTMMDREVFKNANDGFIAIRNAIQNRSNSELRQELYKKVYDYAQLPRPASGGNWDPDYSALAIWAKCNAFVFVIGIDGDDPSYKELDINDPTGAARNAFQARACEAFAYMDYRVPCAPYDGLSAPQKLLKYRCRELQYYCEAYDWLKGANADPTLTGRCTIPPYDIDKSTNNCTPRNRLRRFARNFYRSAKGPWGTIECPTGWKRNHGIMAAAAIGMAGVVLHDAGVEHRYIMGLIDLIRPTPNYSPINWYELGLKYHENLVAGDFIHSEAPQTNFDGSSGYAEGTGYYSYAFACLIPFLRTKENILSNNFIGPRGPMRTKKFYEDPPLNGIFRWAEQINSGEQLPTYDNCPAQPNSLLGLLGNNSGFKFGNSFYGDVGISLYPDYIAIMAIPNKVPLEEVTTLPNSGNTFIKALNSDKVTQHFFHLLHEQGKAIDKSSGNGSHEDDDFASFSLYVNGKAQLALDPTYLGWGEEVHTNSPNHHNICELDVLSNEHRITEEYTDINVVKWSSGFSFFVNNRIALQPQAGATTTYQYPQKREVTAFHLANGELYYILNDYITTGLTSRATAWKLNGNGFIDDATYTYNSSTRISEWTNLCYDYNYKLLHCFGALNGQANPITRSIQMGDNKNQTSSNKHTRLVLKQTAANTIFQNVIIPYKCSNTSLPDITVIERPNYVSTIVESIRSDRTTMPPVLGKSWKTSNLVWDTIRTHHFAQPGHVGQIVKDPFGVGDTTVELETDALNAALSFGTYDSIAPGACSSSAVKFKLAKMINGSFLQINTQEYIKSYENIIAEYSIKSKFRYEGYIDPMGNSGLMVKFYLPDHELGYMMTAKSKGASFPCTYNDTSGILTMTIQEAVSFTIELADPCDAGCFFPPTNQPIDTLLVFDTGELEVLSHDLDIIDSSGNFHIIKGSKMSICPDFVFANKDSLFLHALEGEVALPFQNEMDGSVTTKTSVRERLKTKRSMIIVNDRAALVLDSGSFTHVGDNSTILILKGGTLLVRKGAVLEIGGNEVSGKMSFGEIIAEEGAYVCIEDSSSIYFFVDSLSADTFDNNIFYVSLNDYVPTIAGTNPLGGNGKFVDSDLTGPGIYMGSECIAFCDIKNVMPPHGIQNRDFGWCNFSMPVSRLSVPEFLCADQSIELQDYAVLNETWYSLKVKDGNGHDVFTKTSSADTPRFTTTTLPPLEEVGSYQIILITLNDCGEGDTLMQSITVPDRPQAYFTLSNSGCAGNGSVIADGSGSNGNKNPMKHLWFVQRIDSTFAYGDTAMLPDEYTMDWQIDTLIQPDSAFSFPGFTWVGGYSYIIGLTIQDYCHDSTWTDTVSIPLGVTVTANSLKSANNYIGIYGVELKGVITSPYDSFTWTPAGLLNRIDTLCPITTTLDSTAYILSAYKDNCIARDTIIVKHHEFSHLGDPRIVCTGDSIVIGNYLEASLIIGLVGYLDPAYWGAYFDDLDLYNVNFRQEFTKLFYYSNYEFTSELGNCIVPFVEFLRAHREDFYTKPHYARLYERFKTSATLSEYIDVFKNEFLNEYEDLDALYRDEIELYGGLDAYAPDLRDCFEATVDHMMNLYLASEVSTQWYIDEQESIFDENLFMIQRQINAPTKFGLLVNNNGTIEYDETLVLVDTAITPAFSAGYQIDSTVFFVNHTMANSPVSYLWIFGDGDSSTEVAPFHTYPSFDSIYVACLYATNLCGTYQFCDTVRIDSNATAMFQYSKRDNRQTSRWPEEIQPPSITRLSHRNILGPNRPNPFSGITEIDYELLPDYRSATIRITSMLGQTVRELSLPNVKGTLLLDATSMGTGMYYYTLIVDGTVASSRILVVE